MITPIQKNIVEEYSYVPEHVLSYVTAISKAEPFLFADFLCYSRKDYLIFIGYPLKEEFNMGKMVEALDQAINVLKPAEVSLAAPALPRSITDSRPVLSDDYYRLDLSKLSISRKTINMIARARQELSIERSRSFGKEHRRLIDQFLNAHPVEEATRFIFEQTPHYVASSETALVFNLRNKEGDLVAFDVAELGSKYYAMYMFNFRSIDHYVPGGSDLLLFELIQQAKTEGKRYVNLGLGINPGVSFFKKKWGGVPFLSHVFCTYLPPGAKGLDTLFQKLS